MVSGRNYAPPSDAGSKLCHCAAKICTREAYQPSALFLGGSFGAPWEVYQCPRSKWNHGSTHWSTRAVTKAARVRHKPLARGTDLRHCRTAQLDRARCLSRRSFANAAHVSLLLVCLQLTRFLPYSLDLGKVKCCKAPWSKHHCT